MKRSSVTAGALVLALAAAGARAEDTAMLALANASGCFICHSVTPIADGGTPLAPSYQEVAVHYKGNPKAQEQLVDRVLHGTLYREQNWAGKVAMRFMPPNVNIDRATAENLVNWVLNLDLDQATEERLSRYDRMLALSNLSGCNICHQVDPVNEDLRVIPLAPSYREIAAHYKDQGNAASRLAESVIEGTENQHKIWQNVNMRFMPPNVNIRPEDALALSEWILSLDTGNVRVGPRVPEERP
jgi:cytochrome c